MNNRTFKIQLLLAFAAVYIIWGTTYIAIRFGLEGMKPFVLSTLRYGIAGLLLAGWCVYKKFSLPNVHTLKVLSVSGIMMLVGGTGLVVYAEQFISSGYAAVIIATEPLWFILLDKKNRSTYLKNKRTLIGLLLGFIGIVLFARFSPHQISGHEQTENLIGTLIVLGSAVLWVAGTLYEKNRIREKSSRVVNTTVQLVAAALLSVVIALSRNEWSSFHLSSITASAWKGLIYLIFFGSIIAYYAFNWLVSVQPPAVVSTHTYVNPIVALFFGWLLAGESVSLLQGIALGITLLGVLLTQSKKEKFKQEKEAVNAISQRKVIKTLKIG